MNGFVQYSLIWSFVQLLRQRNESLREASIERGFSCLLNFTANLLTIVIIPSRMLSPNNRKTNNGKVALTICKDHIDVNHKGYFPMLLSSLHFLSLLPFLFICI